jgi:hypothetical protein
VELALTGRLVVVTIALACLTWTRHHRRVRPHPISEAQARENAAPLSTAILASDRDKRARS